MNNSQLSRKYNEERAENSADGLQSNNVVDFQPRQMAAQLAASTAGASAGSAWASATSAATSVANQDSESASNYVRVNEELSRKQGAAMSDPTREEITALIGVSEARTDTKITRMEGKLDLVLSRLESVGEKITASEANRRDDGRSIRANQWVIGFGLAVLIITVVALFPVFFGIGAQVKEIVDHAVESHMPPKK